MYMYVCIWILLLECKNRNLTIIRALDMHALSFIHCDGVACVRLYIIIIYFDTLSVFDSSTVKPCMCIYYYGSEKKKIVFHYTISVHVHG